jgi:putative PIN family toxin of toxin-antitoxin system
MEFGMRMVLDTSVLVAAIRSPGGASMVLVQSVLDRKLQPLISVPLVLEYESVLTRAEHLAVSGFTTVEVIDLIKSFCRMGEQVSWAKRLRPQLRDPGDEFVLETAYYGRANAIVTFNLRDFAVVRVRFGIQVISPREAARRVNPL